MLLARLTVVFVLGSCSPALWAEDLRRPEELAWFNNINAQLAALTQRPADCVAPLDNPRFKLGRLAFNSPRLLGGQAGRMGLSCASCHPSGRDNSDFFIEQISDKPGRADISHHFLSSHGGDAIFNPKPIPDLADVDNLRFKNRGDIEFDHLLTRLIEIEFDGQAPTIAVFHGLKLYLTQNSIENCQLPFQPVPRTLESDWLLIDDGLAALYDAIKSGDSATFLFVSASMRAVLERFYRFYSINPVKSLDDRLLDMSRALESLLSTTLKSDKTDEQILVTLAELSTSLGKLKNDLRQREAQSFYNPKTAYGYLNPPN